MNKKTAHRDTLSDIVAEQREVEDLQSLIHLQILMLHEERNRLMSHLISNLSISKVELDRLEHIIADTK